MSDISKSTIERIMMQEEVRKYLFQWVAPIGLLFTVLSAFIGYTFGNLSQAANVKKSTEHLLNTAAQIGEQKGRVDSLINTIVKGDIDIDELSNTVVELDELGKNFRKHKKVVESFTEISRLWENVSIGGWPAAIRCGRKNSDGSRGADNIYFLTNRSYNSKVVYARVGSSPIDGHVAVVYFAEETEKIIKSIGNEDSLYECLKGDNLSDIIKDNRAYGLISTKFVEIDR